jgi:hypothetical protein
MQFKCRIVAVSLLALLAAASCAELEQPVPEETPIAFSAVVSGDMPATRASGMIQDDAGLQAKGFGVFGCYTGLHNYSESDASSSFMYNQMVEWVSGGDGRWEYDPVKYWPGEEGHKVSFFAYAPYSAGDGTGCIPSYVRYQEKGDPWIMYRIADNVADQVDLLYALPLLDQTKMAVGDRLEFTFKHALACVGEKVTVSTEISNASYEIRLKEVSIDYTLTAKGRLVLWNKGTANWSAVQSEDVVTVRSVSLLTNGSESLPKTFTDQGIFCIPVEAAGYPQKATVHVTYIIDFIDTTVPDVERNTKAELPLKGLIEEGKVLDININLTPEE